MEAGVRDPWNPSEAFVPECPLCSGKVSRDDPAAQALDWGVRTAVAKGDESGFWNVAQAAEIAARDSGASSANIDAFIEQERRMIAAETGWEDLAPAALHSADFMSGDPDKVWWGPAEPESEGEGADPEEEAEAEAERERLRKFGTVLKGVKAAGQSHHYDPGGRDGSSQSSESCNVLSWEFPKRWRPFPPAGLGASDRRAGFTFCAVVEFDPKPPYACACCVFRMFRRYTQSPASTQDPDYWLDQGLGGVMYGGGRPDGSSLDTPDDPSSEGGIYSANGCRLSFFDNPSVPFSTHSLAGEGLNFELTFDFIGAVYDRCREWELVDARRMLLWSKGVMYENEKGEPVVDYDYYAAKKDVPPQTVKKGWTHLNAPKGPGKAESMPGVNVEPDDTVPGEAEKITGECK